MFTCHFCVYPYSFRTLRLFSQPVDTSLAVGSSASDAVHRLNTERHFSRSRVTKGWYQWQWIGTLPTRSFAYKTKVPKKLNALLFDNNHFNDEQISKIANKVGFAKRSAGTINFDEDGNRTISSRNAQLNVNREGALNIYFGRANIKNTELIDEGKAVKIAERMIRDLKFDSGIELKLGHIRHRFTCGGTMKGSGTLENPSAVETIVQFRQCHKGVESVNSDHGLITICIDNDGSIINVYNSARAILEEADRPRSIIPSPPEKKTASSADTDKQFKKAINGIINRSGNSHAKVSAKTTLLREKVGYDFSGSLGLVVHQRDVDVVSGKNLRKRYKIRLRKMG